MTVVFFYYCGGYFSNKRKLRLVDCWSGDFSNALSSTTCHDTLYGCLIFRSDEVIFCAFYLYQSEFLGGGLYL